MDGEGRAGHAVVVEVASSATTVRMEETYRVEEEVPRLHLLQALPEGRKMETVIQGGVELGIHSVIPFACERSRPPDSVTREKLERWRRIALESSRLARRPYLPTVEEPLPWGGVLEMLEGRSPSLYADETGGERPATALGTTRPRELWLLVGPEGGLASAEREALRAAGAVPVSLGETIFRTERAGLVLLAAVRCHLGLL